MSEVLINVPVVLALLIGLNGPCTLTPYEEDVIATWYGGRDGFLGKRHAASWHSKTPVGFPEVVTQDGYGVAAPCDSQGRCLEFGTVVALRRSDTGAVAVGVVVDRMRNYRNQKRYDLWPAVAGRLGFGPEYGRQDRGVVRVDVYVLDGLGDDVDMGALDFEALCDQVSEGFSAQEEGGEAESFLQAVAAWGETTFTQYNQ